MSIPLYLGSYTEPGSGEGVGVQRAELQLDPPALKVLATSEGVKNPSWVLHTADGRLFATEEHDDGAVVALDPETLEVLGRVSSRGDAPCHLAVVGDYVVVANYSSGTVTGLPLDHHLWAEGEAWTLLPGFSAEDASAPGKNPERQEGPHAHFILAVTAGERGTGAENTGAQNNAPAGWTSGEHFLVSDLGRDAIDHYTLVEGQPHLVETIHLPAGTGPRHLSLRNRDLWVVGELDSQLHRVTFNPQPGPGESTWAYDPRPTPLGPGGTTYAEAQEAGNALPQPSEIVQDPDHPALLVAVRGTDTLAVVPLAQARMIGGPELPLPAQSLSIGGAWPRHMAFVDDTHLLVANEHGHVLSLFQTQADGTPAHVTNLPTASPTCVVPVR